jgi:hypothetical protein
MSVVSVKVPPNVKEDMQRVKDSVKRRGKRTSRRPKRSWEKFADSPKEVLPDS